MGGLPPCSPQPPWGSWSQHLAQRHPIPQMVPTLGAGFPKEWGDFYSSVTRWEMTAGSRGIARPLWQLSPVAADGPQGRRGKPMGHKWPRSFGSPELLFLVLWGPGDDGDRFGLGMPV